MMDTKYVPFRLLPLLAVFGAACSSETPAGPSFAGRTYLLHIVDTSWQGKVSAIGDYVPDILMQVDGTAASYDVTMATGRDGLQDLCSPTSHVPATSNPYPMFDLGPTNLPIYLKHLKEPVAVSTTAYNLTMQNLLPEPGIPVNDGTLSVVLDFRETYALFTQIIDPTPDRVCERLVADGVGTCEACPKDGQLYCLTMRADYLGATDVTATTTIVPVASTDPSCFDLAPAAP